MRRHRSLEMPARKGRESDARQGCAARSTTRRKAPIVHNLAPKELAERLALAE